MEYCKNCGAPIIKKGFVCEYCNREHGYIGMDKDEYKHFQRVAMILYEGKGYGFYLRKEVTVINGG